MKKKLLVPYAVVVLNLAASYLLIEDFELDVEFDLEEKWVVKDAVIVVVVRLFFVVVEIFVVVVVLTSAVDLMNELAVDDSAVFEKLAVVVVFDELMSYSDYYLHVNYRHLLENERFVLNYELN